MRNEQCNQLPGAQGQPVPADLRARLLVHLKARGERVVCAAAGGIARSSIARVLAGLPVRLGTLALVERAIEKLDIDAERARAAEEGSR